MWYRISMLYMLNRIENINVNSYVLLCCYVILCCIIDSTRPYDLVPIMHQSIDSVWYLQIVRMSMFLNVICNWIYEVYTALLYDLLEKVHIHTKFYSTTTLQCAITVLKLYKLTAKPYSLSALVFEKEKSKLKDVPALL